MDNCDCDPVGLSEIAERTGIPLATLNTKRWRSKTGKTKNPMPKEDFTIGKHPAWRCYRTFEAWMIEAKMIDGPIPGPFSNP